MGLSGKVVAIAKHTDEVKELEELGVPSFNMYQEAGGGLARRALEAIDAGASSAPNPPQGATPESTVQ